MEWTNILFEVLQYAVFGLALFFVIYKFIRGGEKEARTMGGAGKIGRRTALMIFGIAVLSRLVLLLFSWGATHALGLGRDLLDTWTHWDANQYIRLATEGYFSETEGWVRIVFYPLYSSLVWLVKWVVVDARLAAMLTSWLCLGGASVFLYKLVLLGGDERSARRAVKYLLIFPVGVFLGAGYTESLFLLLGFACLYYARTKRFAIASGFGFMAALTRNAGVLLVVPVFIEMLLAYGIVPFAKRKGIAPDRAAFFKRLPLVLVIPMGTVVYLMINYMLMGDAFAFLGVQEAHWSQQFGSYANSLGVSLGRAGSAGDILRNRLVLWGTQFVVLLIAGLSLPLMAKKLRVSYGAYAIVYLFVVFAPTFLLSGFRYLMGLAVLFPALAMLTKKKWADIALTVVFSLLLPVFTFCFSVQWTVM